MKTFAFALVVVTIQFLSTGLQACDCGCGGCGEPPVHFKDGLTPNGPVTAEPGYADPAYYSSSYYFRDYGPAHVVPPPAVIPPPKRPAS